MQVYLHLLRVPIWCISVYHIIDLLFIYHIIYCDLLFIYYIIYFDLFVACYREPFQLLSGGRRTRWRAKHSG